MKIKIRNGVFETNSSSTHSFTIITEKEKQERQQLHNKKLEELNQKAQAITDIEKANFFKNAEQYKLEKEFIEQYSSSSAELPIEKFVWFESLKEDAEDAEVVLKEQEDAVLEDEPISDEEIKSNLIDRLNSLLTEKSDLANNEEYKTLVLNSNSYNTEMLLWALFKFDNNYNEFVGRSLKLKEISYYHNALKLDVECMYEALVKECCNYKELDKKLLASTNKKMLQKNKVELWAKKLYEHDKKLKDFIENNQYTDYAQALIKFVKEENNSNNQNKNHLGAGTLYYCNYDYQEIFDIYLTLSNIKDKISIDNNNELTYEEFAKEFLSDKYNIYWIKDFDDGFMG